MAFAAVLSFASAALTSDAAAQGALAVQGHVVAASGLPVDIPGFAGVTFHGTLPFDLPVLDENGRVSFRARLAGAGLTATTDRAVFSETAAGTLQAVVMSGAPAPGLPGVSLASATGTGPGGAVRAGPDGDLLVGTWLSGPGVTSADETALLVASLSGVALAVRQGDPAPGTGGAILASPLNSPPVWTTAINRDGRIVFKSQLAGGDTTPANDAAWFGGSAGALELIQRRGDMVLGGEIVAGLGTICQVNDAGQTLHDEVLGSGLVPVTPANDRTLWLHLAGAGNLLLVREGDPAPGTGGAAFGEPSGAWTAGVPPSGFNRNGVCVFAADLVGPGVVAGANDRGIFLASIAGVALVARKGEPAPGTSGVLGSMGSASLSLDGAGRVAFQASISGGGATAADDTGIWTGASGALALVAREGQPAPGTAGARFGSLSGTQLVMNDRGQILFSAPLAGGDVTGSANSSALYAFDPACGLVLVLRGGDAIAVAPGVTKTAGPISFLSWNGGDGAALGFNHAGDVVLRVTMTDGGAAILRGRIGPLAAEPAAIAAATGGVQTLWLDAGPARGGHFYLVAGTASGAAPGFTYGPFTVPLNPDPYFWFTLAAANTWIFGNTSGILSAAGRATATITLPPGLPGLAGVELRHAFACADAYGVASFVSDAALLRIVP